MATFPPFGRAPLLAALLVLAFVIAVPVASARADVLRVAPRGADAGDCAGAPCRTVAFAATRAGRGDVIELADGRHGTIRLAGRGRLRVRAAAGAAAAVDRLEIDRSGVSVKDVQARVVDVSGNGPIRNVTLTNITASEMYMRDVHDVTVSGGSVGNTRDKPTVLIDGNPASTGITFDGVDFHDAVATNASVHMECIWAGGVQRFTVRNSIFRNCAYFDIFFTRLNGPDPKDVLLENNVFEVTRQWNGQPAPYAINVANWLSKVENFTIRNNTFGGDMTIQPGAISNVVVAGNLGVQGSCKGGVRYASNVWSSRRCHASDKQASSWLGGIISPGAHDWRLRAGSAAIDAADPTLSPERDRDGKTRVGRPDAGAYEHGVPAPGGTPAQPRPPGCSPTSPGQGTPGPAAPGDPFAGGPQGAAAPAALLSRRRVCRRARAGCPRRARLRVALGAPGRVVVKLRRKGRLVRKVRREAADGTATVRLKAKRLRRGTYKVVVVGRGADGAPLLRQALKLRVR